MLGLIKTPGLNSCAHQVSEAPPGGRTGDLIQLERCTAVKQVLTANPNINQVVGHSLFGCVALAFEKRSHKTIKSIRCSCIGTKMHDN